MSFDKAKYTRNAERFLTQGKIRAAISEYKRIVENDPKDFSTLNLLGDLCVKAQDTGEAVKCYTQVAEHYANQGFAQKAIAIYNKISRLMPDSIEVSAKLAQLYQSKGSIAEARSHYSNLADYYQKRGQKTEALEIWKQIAELDPNNTEIYLKIGEMCRQQDQKDEAAEAYTEAGARFAAKKQFEQAMSAYSKSLEIKPSNLVALNGLVNSQIGLGYADDAARTLEEMLEKQPYNREILNLLVNCYLDVNNSSAAERAVIKLVEQEPANYPKFLDVTKSYLKDNDLESAARILSMTSEHLLVGGQAEELGAWVNEILAKNPEQIDALRLLVRYHGWQRDETELKQSLERLAESAQMNEAVEDERYALSQLVLIVPQESSYAQRLQEINEQYGYPDSLPSAEESLLINHDSVIEVPTFEGYAVSEMDSADFASSGNGGAELFLQDYVEFKPDENFGESADAFDYEKLYQNGSSSNGYAYASGESAIPLVVTEFDSIASEAEEDNTETVSFGEQTEVISDTQTASEINIIDEARLKEELETVEYYFSQGYQDLAVRTLESLAAQFGEMPEIEAARKLISGESVVEEQIGDDFESTVSTLNETSSEEEEATAAVESNPAPTNFDELNDFRSELGLEEQTSLPEGDYDTHYQMGVAYQEMGLMEDAIREYQDAIKLVSPRDGTNRFFQCCNLLGHCFMEKSMPNIALMWYRQGLENSNLGETELQGLRYEIANAYEAGGDVSKAVEYFEQIYAVDVEYRDVSQRLNQLQAAAR